MTTLRVLLVVGLVGLTLARRNGGDGGGLFGGRAAALMDPRLGINIARIIQLEKHIETIRERLEEAKEVDPEQFVDDVNARMEKLEESHCEDHEFQCGEERECVSDLFICDGHDDCHNAHDEDDDVCSTDPVKPGNILTGVAEWKSCLERDDHLVSLNIISMKRFKFFPGRLIVRAISEATFEDDEGHEATESYHLRGYYNFANRQLWLIHDDDSHDDASDDDTNMALKCDFDHGDDERADCELVYRGSMHVCAEIHLSLEEHDDDEDEDDDDDGRHGYYDTTGYEEEHKDDDDDHDKDKHHKDDDDDDDDKRRHKDHDDDDDDKRHKKDDDKRRK